MIGRDAVFYSTLHRAKRQVNETPDETSDDADMREALRYVTRRIDEELRERSPFFPLVETEYLNARVFPGGDVSSYDLVLRRPLLELTALANGEGTAITSGEYTLLPRARAPYARVRLKLDGATTWLTADSGETEQVIAVQGIWGSRDDYVDAFLASGDSIGNEGGLNATDSVSSVTVSDARGLDSYRRSPRFSPGQLVRMESEFGAVLGVDYDENRLDVLRGVLGTTKATHAKDIPLRSFEVDQTIQYAAAVWAAYCYKRRGRYENTEFVPGAGVARTFPKDIPPEVAGILGLKQDQGKPGGLRILKV